MLPLTEGVVRLEVVFIVYTGGVVTLWLGGVGVPTPSPSLA